MSRFQELGDDINRITADVVGAAIEVQRHLGSGLLEKTYESALSHELALRGREVLRQVPIHARYKDAHLQTAHVLDLEVDGRVAVELKTVEAVIDEHVAQLATYLRFGGYPVGLLVNFRASPMRDGIFRVINPFRPGGARDTE